MQEEDSADVLRLFTQQPFYQQILKLEAERGHDPPPNDGFARNELALYIQNVSFSLQSGGWDPAKITGLALRLASALNDLQGHGDAALCQSVLLGMLHGIKAHNARMSDDCRSRILGQMQEFDNTSAEKQSPQTNGPAVLWPMSLRKVILTRSPERPTAENSGVTGWVDALQQPWREEWSVHVILHDAVGLGRASVHSHDGVFVLISFPKTQVWDAELFLF
jgi:hypothetical protein